MVGRMLLIAGLSQFHRSADTFIVTSQPGIVTSFLLDLTISCTSFEASFTKHSIEQQISFQVTPT